MSYSSHQSSSHRPTVIHNSYAPSTSSTTTTTYSTMSSSRDSSSVRTDSRGSSSRGEFRDPRAGNYTGRYSHHSGNVTVYQYAGAKGYERAAPTPSYQSSTSKEQHRPSRT